MSCRLHDICHLVESDAVPMIHEGESLDDSVGVIDHEKIGADFARMNGYGSIIEDLILTHVDAKRVSKPRIQSVTLATVCLLPNKPIHRWRPWTVNSHQSM